MIDGLLAAVGFLTRIPVPGWVFARPGGQACSLPWYPLVGMLICAVLSALAWCLRDAAPLLGRTALVAAFLTTPYVRAGGLGSGLVGSARACLLLSLLLGIACVFAAGLACGTLACALAAVVFLLWRRACLQRLGGMTGDTCGALVEVSETAVLVALALQAS
ncbi:adenosylcobinamide-GDP ribazoletransferase [Xanthomonas bromi]|uniref:Adenosylcobinamide-GDP ribazoletransferase n=1 Tax=Xanthomonas bromi TaxID=56449 RepID=A0A1C3NJI4_9XANT|nr:adenosylcobinamide-GDP ribazoletransferase [Xanthomonas bromi]PPV07341.1 hypothetical protein XbrCFBP1976_08135 [Xanthomonas bromi]SBV50572.1 adenosylcobinamide-GDP ribazoletransferase [Xanthomonas bromi]